MSRQIRELYKINSFVAESWQQAMRTLIGNINTILVRIADRLDAIESGDIAKTTTESAPESPENGSIRYADGTNWDPIGDGNPHLVGYVNDSWTQLDN